MTPVPSGDRKRLWFGIAAILVVAFLVVALPSGKAAADIVSNAVNAAFLVAIAATLVQLYRRQSEWLSMLSDRDRGIVYGAIAIGLLAIVAAGRFRALWNGGIVLVIVILAICAAAVYWVWSQSRRWTV